MSILLKAGPSSRPFDPVNPLPKEIAKAIIASGKYFNNADRSKAIADKAYTGIALMMWDAGITSAMLKADGGNGSKDKPYSTLKRTTREAIVKTFHPKAQYLINLDRDTASKTLKGKASDPVSPSGMSKTKADRDRQNSNLSSRFFKVVKSIEGYEAGGDGTNQGANQTNGKTSTISAQGATCTVKAKTPEAKILIALHTVRTLAKNLDKASFDLIKFNTALDKAIKISATKMRTKKADK